MTEQDARDCAEDRQMASVKEGTLYNATEEAPRNTYSNTHST